MIYDDPKVQQDGDDDTPEIVHPDPDSPGTEAGQYVHPEGVPGDPVVDNSQLG